MAAAFSASSVHLNMHTVTFGGLIFILWKKNRQDIARKTVIHVVLHNAPQLKSTDQCLLIYTFLALSLHYPIKNYRGLSPSYRGKWWAYVLFSKSELQREMVGVRENAYRNM